MRIARPSGVNAGWLALPLSLVSFTGTPVVRRLARPFQLDQPEVDGIRRLRLEGGPSEEQSEGQVASHVRKDR
jgi:hypothetical protein